jgi:hypothetical protein
VAQRAGVHIATHVRDLRQAASSSAISMSISCSVIPPKRWLVNMSAQFSKVVVDPGTAGPSLSDLLGVSPSAALPFHDP